MSRTGGVRPSWRVAALLVALVVVAFAPAVAGGFVEWDDQHNFERNPHFRGVGWPQLCWAWTTYLLGVYQPLAWMLLELQSALWGLRPQGYHAASVALHALNAVILYWLGLAILLRVRRPDPGEGPAPLHLAAGLAAALFAVHPLRAEAVAWASCQPYLPCIGCGMMAVLAYLGSHPPGGPADRRGLIVAWALMLAALLFKAVAVGLPAVLIVLDYYPLRRIGPGRWWDAEARRAWREKVPFVALGGWFTAVAVVAKAHEAAIVPTGPGQLGTRVAQAALATCFYVSKTLAPINLSHLYVRPSPMGLAVPRDAACLALLLAATAALAVVARRNRGPLAAWLAFLAVLAPNSGLLATGLQLAADRYSYAATIGPAVLLAAGLRAWIGRLGSRAVVGPAVVVLAAWIGLTWRACRTWRDSEAMWSHALAVGHGHIAALHNNLGGVRIEQGRLAEALEHFQAAVRLEPTMPAAQDGLGVTLARLGRSDEALARYREALRLNSQHARANFHIAQELLRRGRPDEAAGHLRVVLRAWPNWAEALRLLDEAERAGADRGR